MKPFELCAFADEASPELDGQISALCGNGMKLIELRGVDGKNVAELSPAEAKNVKERLDRHGIRVWSIGSPIGKTDVNSPAAIERDRFKRILETARICGAGNIRLFSFYGTDGSSASFDLVCRQLDDMLTDARGSGVELCHENEKDIWGDTAARCEALHLALPALRGIFDPANFVQCGEGTLAAWDLLGKYIKYAHIKDAKADGHVVPAGQGDGRIPELLPRFCDAGIEVLTLEPHLKVFKGLAGLEKGDVTAVVGGRTAFPDGRSAFDYASETLKKLISEM